MPKSFTEGSICPVSQQILSTFWEERGRKRQEAPQNHGTGTGKQCDGLNEQHFGVGEALRCNVNQIKHGESWDQIIKGLLYLVKGVQISQGRKQKEKGECPSAQHQNSMRKMKVSGGGNMGERGQQVQTSNYKIKKSESCHIQHGDYC